LTLGMTINQARRVDLITLPQYERRIFDAGETRRYSSS
jgi:hypothetical protein